MLKRADNAGLAAMPVPPRPALAPWIGLCGFALLGAVANLLLLVGPVFMLQVYDRVLPSRSVPTLVALTLLALGLYGFYALVETLRARIAIRVGAFVEEKLSPELIGAIARSSGQGRADPMRDLDSVRSFLAGSGPAALCDLPWIPAYLLLIYLLHPLLGLVTAGGAGLIVLLLVASEIASRGPVRQIAALQARRQALAEDIALGGEVAQAMAMLPALSGAWDRLCSGLAEASRRSADRSALFSALSRALRYGLQSAVLASGAWLVLAGQSTAGLIIGASIISARAVAPVEQAVGQWRGLVAARQAWARLSPLLAAGGDARGLQLPPPLHRLAVDNLATAAPGRDRPVLSGVGFRLKAGDGLGVVGLSGSGKSSLARALVGAWPHLAGNVRLDGQLLTHYPAPVLGASIGYMPQDVGLFAGTVAQNIARFLPDAPSSAVIAAARAAGIHDLIATLPDGYETQVGLTGLALSGGQRQRIGLARALYGDPFLIVLDEPNSNLDARGDAALTQALLAARGRGAIVVVIAHRPSAIAAVDQLLLLDAGRQAAFGPKSDVLKALSGGEAALREAGHV